MIRERIVSLLFCLYIEKGNWVQLGIVIILTLTGIVHILVLGDVDRGLLYLILGAVYGR